MQSLTHADTLDIRCILFTRYMMQSVLPMLQCYYSTQYTKVKGSTPDDERLSDGIFDGISLPSLPHLQTQWRFHDHPHGVPQCQTP